MLAGLLALILVLPQSSAVLAGLGLADGRVMVICTGDGLRTITLDDAGTPVEVSSETEVCALVHAVDTSVGSVGADPWQQEFHAKGTCFHTSLRMAQPACALSHPRAPPAVLFPISI